ncbi:MAG: transposase [bacterium]|nr:transposase [bacterium]
MARKSRIEYPGAFYHVMARGNHRESIFRDDHDRERFLKKLLEYKERYGFILYAYTLMSDHIHLLIEVRKEPLSRVMQGLLQSHTQWYNRKYKTVGHLFQGRYKAILCDKNNYLLTLLRYIHLNPVRAGIVKEPAKYRWSSHRAYLDLDHSDIVDTEFVLTQLSSNTQESRQIYQSFVQEWVNESKEEDFYRTIDQRFLGEEDFIEEVKKKSGEELLIEDDVLKNKTLDEIAKEVEKLTGVTLSDLYGRCRKKEIVEARSLFVRLALLYTKYKRKEIAEYLGRVPRIIAYLVGKLSDEKLQSIKAKLQW